MFGVNKDNAPTVRLINGQNQPPTKYTWGGNAADGISSESMK
jgi:hypothetical protein